MALRGETSDLLLPSTAREMTWRGPKAELIEVPGCGHAPALMDPQQIGSHPALAGNPPRHTLTGSALPPPTLACASFSVSNTCGASARSARLAPSFSRMNALVV